MRNRFLFVEKMILAAYREFFGKMYLQSNDRSTAHIEMQKMCYLLSLYGIRIGDFGFVWNIHGPFSVGLQACLRKIDGMPDDIRQFYSEYKSDEVFDSETLKRISEASQKLLPEDKKENGTRWLELLGSLAFIGNSESASLIFDNINPVLKYRKPAFNSDDENENAWKLLEDTHLVC